MKIQVRIDPDLRSQLGLLRTPRPFPDESIKGYLLRVTEVNGYGDPIYILNLAGMKAYLTAYATNMNWPKLSTVLKVDLRTLKKMAYCYFKGKHIESPKVGVFQGNALRSYQIRRADPKICPECLKEASYIPQLWDLAAVKVCPIHNCYLVELCPYCDKKIIWDRSGVCICRCGGDWRNLKVKQVDAAQALLSYLIYRSCGKHKGIPFPCHLIEATNPLLILNLAELLTTVFFISGQMQGLTDATGKNQINNLSSINLNNALLKAVAVFHNWPSTYFKFLEEIKGKKPRFNSATGLHKDFGQFYIALYRRWDVSLPQFLKDAFEVYLAKHWDGGRSSIPLIQAKHSIGDRKYITLSETMRFCDVSRFTIEHYLKTGFLKAKFYEAKSARVILIDTESVKALKDFLDSGSLMDAQAVGKYLGIGDKVVLGLASENYLQLIRGPSIDGHTRWIFEKPNVDTLVSRLNELAVKFEKKEGLTLIKLRSAIFTLTPVGMKEVPFLKLILQGVIKPYMRSETKRISDFLFSKPELLKYLNNQIKIVRKNAMSVEDVRKIVGLRHDNLQLLIKKGLFQVRKGKGQNYSVLVAQREIDSFNAKYIFIAKLAKELKTSPKYLARQLMASGIIPASGPKIDGGLKYVFNRSDLNNINLTTLIKHARKESKKMRRNKRIRDYYLTKMESSKKEGLRNILGMR